jgi:hypothetical protein
MYRQRLYASMIRLCSTMSQHSQAALIAAATEGHAPVVKLLLDAKVIDVNRANEVSTYKISA